jgi:hypothetical protein
MSASWVRLGLIGLLSAMAAAASAENVMLVYLPSAPIESASRLGEAVTDLGTYLNESVPGLGLNVRPFRRGEDATEYLATQGQDVAVVLCDSAFLLDLPPGFSALPSHRLVRGGRETQRKIVVVASAAGARSMADLKGRTLSLAQSGGSGSARFLARVVFDGEIAPESWFANLVPEADEFTATANVLFGRADAALVSEDNPLVMSHLGKELRTVYTSGLVSLPVLAFRTGALPAEQQAALEAALDGLARRPEARKILEGLRVDGLARVRDGGGRTDRAGLLALPGDERRQPEVASVGLRDLTLPALPAATGGQAPFLVGFTLPELPMPVLDPPQRTAQERVP